MGIDFGINQTVTCGVCTRHVSWEDRAVCCTILTVHNIHTESYEKLKTPKVSWICRKCGEVNYSQYTFESSIRGFGDLSSNSFHPLSASFNSTINSDTSFSRFGYPMFTSSPEKPLKTSKLSTQKEKDCKSNSSKLSIAEKQTRTFAKFG